MSALKWMVENALNLVTVLSVVLSAAMIILSSKFATRRGVRAAHSAIHQRLDGHHNRIMKVEGAMDGLATKQDVNEVLVALARQDGDRKELSAKVDGVKNELVAISRPLTLIHEYLLNQQGKR